MEYFLADGNDVRGPYTVGQLAVIGLKPETLVWCDASPARWPAGSVPELTSLFVITQLPPTTSAISELVPAAAHDPAIAKSQMCWQAIASLVLGLLALATMSIGFGGLVLGSLAFLVGFEARSETRRTGKNGYGMATAGVVCGALAVLLYVDLIFLTVEHYSSR